jgi:predicted nuclease of predicted toxin-antitoxin system
MDANAEMKAALDALTARLTRLEDERAILDTLHRYGQAADAGDADIWAGLFTEEGVFAATDRDGRTLFSERGRPALAQWLRNFRAGEKRVTKHVVLAPVIEIDGARATVTSYLTRLSENAGDPYDPPFVLLMGRYVDSMVKGADGRWRFAERVARTEAPLIRKAG